MKTVDELIKEHAFKTTEAKDAFIRGYLVGKGIADYEELKNFRWERSYLPSEVKITEKLYHKDELICTFNETLGVEND